MKKITLISMLITVTTLTCNIAAAEGQKLKDKLSQGQIVLTADIKGCDEDLNKFCPGLDPNSENASLCMMAYEHKLSKQCQLGIMEAAIAVNIGASAINYSVQACEADADKYCLDVKPGEGRLVSCIRKHESEVSKSCVSALKETGLWELGSK